MSNIVVSGLVNVETTLNIGNFPVEYSPIEYKFFGLKSNVPEMPCLVPLYIFMQKEWRKQNA